MKTIILISCIYYAWGAPSDEGWVTKAHDSSSSEVTSRNNSPNVPKIYSMRVDVNVTNRFASSLVTSKVKNLDVKPHEATFSVVLPETAFISGFTMEIDGKKYEAYIQEKEKAKNTYDKAVSSGYAAAHVAVSARDSNKFTVSVNIMPQSKATFYLKYQELLKRQKGFYDIVVNLHPGQPVQDMSVQVNINETRPLTSVSTPSLRSGNEISKNDLIKPNANIEFIGKNAAAVIFKPDLSEQEFFAKELGTNEKNGFAGQFVVQYDVERDPQGGELLYDDGYFIHFFAPKDVIPEPKQISFVLDTSGSMSGDKIRQLKEAMNSILDQLKPEDSFNIIDFSSAVNVWNVSDGTVQYQEGAKYSFLPYLKASRNGQVLPESFEVSEQNIARAKHIINLLKSVGGTNIHLALDIALQLYNQNKAKDERQPIIMFLTDGQANEGVTYSESIISKVTEQNSDHIPIICLSFGKGADSKLLTKLSLRNQGFARHIYEAADADIQLKSFYEDISSPLFNKIKFTYDSGNFTDLTKAEFPILFNGSELVVAGKYDTIEVDPGFAPSSSRIFKIVPLVRCFSGPTSKEFKATPARSIGSLEKHWVYLTLKQILQEREISDKKEELTKKALDLALKYSFVTPVSSLIVVKPNETNAESDIQDASKDSSYRTTNALNYYSNRRRPLTTPAPFHLLRASVGPPGVSFSNTFSLKSIGFPRTPMAIQPNIRFMKTTDSLTTSGLLEDLSIRKLKNELPWFIKQYNDNNDTISLPQGKFLIGINNQVPEPFPVCQKNSFEWYWKLRATQKLSSSLSLY